MQVLKFGGTSVGTSDSIKNVIKIVQNANQNGRVVCVVSAFSGITDLLIDTSRKATNGDESFNQQLENIKQRHYKAVNELVIEKNKKDVQFSIDKLCNEIENICKGLYLLRELSMRTNDLIISYGELLSSTIISNSIPNCILIPIRELIKTNDNYGNALVDFKTTDENILNYFTKSSQNLFLAPGFIASDKNGNATTLGRGGSDYTAAIIASSINASILEIWTDVSGMMTADPRLVQNAKPISHISYKEAMELSHFGAKVIYPPTIHPVMKKNIPTWVKNSKG